MGHVIGKVAFVFAVLLVTVLGVWAVLRAGDRPYRPPGRAMPLLGRRREARVLAVLIAAAAAGVVAAVLTSWPTT